MDNFLIETGVQAVDDIVTKILGDKMISLPNLSVASLITGSFQIIQKTYQSYRENILTLVEKTVPVSFNCYKFLILSATETCMQKDFNIWELSDPEQTASEQAHTYLETHEISYELDSDRKHIEGFLTEILCKSISVLRKKCEKNPEFQQYWNTLAQREFQNLSALFQELWNQFSNLREDITCMKEDISNLKDTVTQHDQVISGMQLPASIKEWRSYYQKIWNKPGFLDRDNPNAKNLGDFYKLPTCTRKSKRRNLSGILKACIFHSNCTQNRMLLVLGEPGVGKSTLISYLLNEKALSTKNRLVRVYRFCKFNASAWDTDPDNIPQQILIQTSLTEERLCHSVLILDGLDEINLQGNYAKFINSLYDTWADNDEIEDFSLIVTCRNTRISDYKELDCSYVVLNALDNGQIEEFAIDYLGYCPENLKQCIDENEDLHEALGIPIILYMVLALKISVSSDTTMAEIYHEIFTPTGENSIYRRSYTENHPIITEEMAQKIHEFSKQAAVKMWDLHPREAALTQEEWTGLAEELCGDSDWKNLLVGQYFVEGQEGHELCFVHRSMPEYFVALSFFDAIQNITSGRKTPEQLFEEIKLGTGCTLTPFADVLGVCYLPGFPEIAQNLQYLLKKDFTKIGKDGDWWRQLIDCFCKDGLADAAIHRKHGGERGIWEETTRFFNLLWIGREYLKLCGEKVPYQLLPDRDNYEFPLIYFQAFAYFQIDMQDIDLNYAVLEFTHFEGANLKGTILKGTYLEESKLNGANLEGANLYNAFLRDADLGAANLKEAYLGGADLENTNLDGATLPDGRIYEDALEADGPDMMLQFTNPYRWNDLHPYKQVNPYRYF